jgi:tRNA threonylcarbamoyl adenosine modification protein (Sua5/YciO/YrdC/YwlC family)
VGTLHLVVHRSHPQPRVIAKLAESLRAGALAVIPTDGCYALACHLEDKIAVDRLRRIRGIDERHLLTLLCADLSQLSTYAQVSNQHYRFLKAWTPGPYTFVLPATREVPKRLAHPARKTLGLRVPDEPTVSLLLAELGEPLLASTLRLPGDELPLGEPEQILSRLKGQIDVFVDVGQLGTEATSIVDLTGAQAVLQREGLGAAAITAAFS